MASQDFVSDSEFKPDQAQSPDFVPDEQFKPDSPNPAKSEPNNPDSPDFIPDSQFVSDDEAKSNKYNTPDQQLKAGLEGAAQGILGPLAPLAETKLFGIDPADIKGRAEENPFTHGLAEAGAIAGSMLTGVGEAGLIAKAVPEVAALGKLGSMAFKGAIESMALQGGDEASKYLIGDQDPQTPVASALAHIGAAGLFGAGGGTLFGVLNLGTNKGLQALEDAKLGNKAQSFLTGYGAASRGHSLEEIEPMIAAGYDNADKAMLKAGAKLYNTGPEAAGKFVVDKAVRGAGAVGGIKLAGPWGAEPGIAAAKKYLEPTLEKLIGKPISAASRKFILPVLTKVLTTGETKGLGTALDYATKASKGAQTVNKSLDSLFRIGGQQAINAEVDDRQRNKIEQYIDDAGLQKEFNNTLQADPMPQQGYAEGGNVISHQEQDHFAKTFPDQNMLLSTAKGRVYTYLNSLKPRQSVNKLPFDHDADQAPQKRAYDRALDIAANPMSIMNHIKKGNITPQHITHFNSMWPELHDHLSKEITQRIIKSQVGDTKPSFKVRQALSLFLGSPLEATFTPNSIQAAQTAFTPMQPPQQAGKPKKDTGKIGSKSNAMYQTPDENAEQDRSTRD